MKMFVIPQQLISLSLW